MGLVVPEDHCCIQEPSLLTQDAKCLFHRYIKADLHNLSANMTPAKWFSCLFHVFFFFFIRRGVHPFFSEGAGRGTMGPRVEREIGRQMGVKSFLITSSMLWRHMSTLFVWSLRVFLVLSM